MSARTRVSFEAKSHSTLSFVWGNQPMKYDYKEGGQRCDGQSRGYILPASRSVDEWWWMMMMKMMMMMMMKPVLRPKYIVVDIILKMSDIHSRHIVSFNTQ